MEYIRLFENKNEFLTEKPNLPFPCVSFVEETQEVEYANVSMISAKYRLTQEIYDSYSSSGISEVILFSGDEGLLQSYTINGETHVFEEPKYEDNIVNVELTNNSYIPVYDEKYCIWQLDLTTEMSWISEKEINNNDKIIFVAYDHYYDEHSFQQSHKQYTVQQCLEENLIILHDEHTFSLTENMFSKLTQDDYGIYVISEDSMFVELESGNDVRIISEDINNTSFCQYPIVNKQINYENIPYGEPFIALEDCIQCGIGNFNTAMTWSTDGEIDVENDAVFSVTYVNGEIVESNAMPISALTTDNGFTVSEDKKSFSLTQEYCDMLNDSSFLLEVFGEGTVYCGLAYARMQDMTEYPNYFSVSTKTIFTKGEEQKEITLQNHLAHVISKDNYCIEGGKGLFNTAMTWTIDREIDLDNYYLCESIIVGEKYDTLCYPLQDVLEWGFITLHSNNKSFSLTQDYCDDYNRSEGLFIGLSIVESNCVTIMPEESGIGIITSQPTTVTTFNNTVITDGTFTKDENFYFPTIDSCFSIDEITENIEFTMDKELQEDLYMRIIMFNNNEMYLSEFYLDNIAIPINEYTFKLNKGFIEEIKWRMNYYETDKIIFQVIDNYDSYNNNIQTTVNSKITSNKDKAFTSDITINCSEENIDQTFDCKFVYSENADNIGYFRSDDYQLMDLPSALYDIDLSKLDDKKSYIIPALSMSLSMIENISISDNITTIGSYAFMSEYLKTIKIGKGVTIIGADAFESPLTNRKVYINSLEDWCKIDFVVNPGNSYYGEDDWRGANPLRFSDLYVNDEKVTDLIIPGTIESISDYAFMGCNLDSITLHENITLSGNEFFECNFKNAYIESLNSICSSNYEKIVASYQGSGPCGVTYTYYNPFSDCNIYVQGELLTNLIIPEGVTRIGDCAFYNFKNLTSVTIASTIKEMGDDAFGNCENLREIKFLPLFKPEFYDNIYNCSHPFKGVAENGTIDIPMKSSGYTTGIYNSIVYLEKWFVHKHDNYDNVNWDVTAIYNVTDTTVGTKLYYDYMEGRVVRMIVDGNEVTPYWAYSFDTIGEHEVKYVFNGLGVPYQAFLQCNDLISIEINSHIIAIRDYSLAYNPNLTTLKINEGVQTIGYGFIRECPVSEIIIPNTVKTLSICAFQDCTNLNKITIGSSVTEIGRFAFDNCTNLTEITCNALTAPTIEYNTFENMASNGILYYPKGSDYSSWMSYLGNRNWTSQEFEPNIEE